MPRCCNIQNLGYDVGYANIDYMPKIRWWLSGFGKFVECNGIGQVDVVLCVWLMCGWVSSGAHP